MVIDLAHNPDHTYSAQVENMYIAEVTASSNQVSDPSQSSISKFKSKTEFL